MKKFLFIFTFIFLSFILVGCGSSNTMNNSSTNTSSASNSMNYETEKLSLEPIEKTVATFSTNILDKDSGRQTNISITCSVLSGTIIKPGETFSFCDTVGKATPERGYKEAKVFDADGNVTMGYGGGNCQVSSTLYNAVLQDTNFEIIERHPHSQHVYYVEERKRCCCCLW